MRSREDSPAPDTTSLDGRARNELAPPTAPTQEGAIGATAHATCASISEHNQYSNALTTALINDSLTTEILLDTGACTSLMNAQLARMLGAAIRRYTGQPITGVKQSHLDVVGETRIKLRLCGTDIHITVGLVEDLEYQVLVGTPALHEHGIVIDMGRKEVRVESHQREHQGSNCRQPIRLHRRGPRGAAAAATQSSAGSIGVISDQEDVRTEADEPNACAVRLRYACTIQPHSFRWVEAVVRDRHGKAVEQAEGTVIAFDTNYHTTRTMPLQGVIAVRRGRACIPIANVTDHPTFIRKGTRVATFKRDETPENTEDTAGVAATTSHNNGESQQAREEEEPQTEERKSELRDIRAAIMNLEVDEEITPEQRARLQRLLLEYEDVFAKHPKRVKSSLLPKHHIDTMGHSPINTQSYRRSPAEEEIIDAETKDLLAAGIIRPSCSPWNSNIVLVKKKDGTHRMCLDLRPLNAVTKRDCYPLPRIDATLDAIQGARYWSSVDLQAGFHQIDLDEESMEKTSFRTRNGAYEYTRLVFGLQNAATSFQRNMDLVLHGYINQFAAVYIDDVLLWSADFDSHLEHIEKALQRFRQYGLQLKWEKSHWVRKSVPFLGHIVSRQGIAPDPAKIEAMQHYDVPRTVRQVRRFLGAAGYYRAFIPEFARRAAALTELTKAHTRFRWGPEEQRAFDDLRTALVAKPVLAFPRRDRPYTLTTDASDEGLGAVLAQPGDDGQLHPVAYASKKLIPAEQNYHSTEKEALAIVWALKAFRPYLLGAELTVETDCMAALHVFTKKQPTARIMRWLVEVAEFSPLRCKYRKGTSNQVADALSRAPRERGPYDSAAEALEGAPPRPLTIVVEGEDRKVTEHTIATHTTPSTQEEDDEEEELLAQCSADAHVPAIAALHPVSVLQRPRSARIAAEVVTVCPIGEDFEPQQAAHRRAVREAQEADPYTQRRLTHLESGELPEEADATERTAIMRETREMSIIYGLLYIRSQARGAKKREKRTMQLVVPQSMREEVMRASHESILGGHLGFDKVLAKVREQYYWPRMYSDIQHWIQSCTVCQQRKQPVVANRGEPQTIVATRPFEIVSMDVLSLTPAASGDSKVLVIIDHFTRYAWTVAIPDENQDTIARAFIDTILIPHGAPEKLLTDRGAPFMAALNRNLFKQCKIKELHTSPMHPQTNGMTERLNRTLCNILAAYVNDRHNDWPEYLHVVTAAYNHSTQASTHETPYYLFHMRDPIALNAVGTHVAQESFISIDDFRAQKIQQLLRAKQLVARNEVNRAEWQQALPHRRPQGHQFQVGEQVLRRTPSSYDGRTTKLAREWQGPYRIAEIIDSNTVRLFNATTQEPDQTPINVSLLKPYIEYNNPNGTDRQQHPQAQPEPRNQQDPNTFEIDRILQQRVRNGKVQYQVRWRGYSARHNSWVNAEDIDAEELLHDFEREQAMTNRRNREPETATRAEPETNNTRRSTRVRRRPAATGDR